MKYTVNVIIKGLDSDSSEDAAVLAIALIGEKLAKKKSFFDTEVENEESGEIEDVAVFAKEVYNKEISKATASIPELEKLEELLLNLKSGMLNGLAQGLGLEDVIRILGLPKALLDKE